MVARSLDGKLSTMDKATSKLKGLSDDEDEEGAVAPTDDRSESSDEEEESSSAASTSRRTDSDGTNGTTGIVGSTVTNALKCSKFLVLSVLFLAAVAIGGLTYYVVREEETDDFVASFNDYAIEISELVHMEAKNIFFAVESMSATTTSFALDNGDTPWPYVTMSHFETRGYKNNQISAALQITFVPLVSEENKEAWEGYSVLSQGWIADSLEESQYLDYYERADVVKVPQGHHVPEPISYEIWRWDDESVNNASSSSSWSSSSSLESSIGSSTASTTQLHQGHQRQRERKTLVDFGPARHAPVWQQAPAPRSNTSIINFNLFSHPTFARIYHGMWETRLPVLSEVTDLTFLYGEAVVDDASHPHSFLLHPVYPSFNKKSYERDDIVGFYVAVLGWDLYLSNLLPAAVTGIQVVLHDSCGDHFTYQIDGPTAIFLGMGDLHDRKYNFMQVNTDFAPFLRHNFSDIHDHCEYDLRIYPSVLMEEQFRTDKPVWYAAAIVAVFFVTALAFVGYDWLVNRRQAMVMRTLRKTNAVISSVFPAMVRDRIFEEAKAAAEAGDSTSKKLTSAFGMKSQLKSFLSEGEEVREKESTGGVYETQPIADLFPEVTVMFGDIVGFTAWSSIRQPHQVFTLLETLYSAFDDIARRRRVFKVETVGDCYVAVSGLPERRPDHALVIARFANDCLSMMNDQVKKLETKLGPDTGELSLRVGVHSGPVIAGVLRGDKARFQLFGDTMNTTARCESTGEPNRIHVTSDAANLLKSAGKGHWLTERPERVTAKGKGEMITYWLSLKKQSGGSVVSTSNTSETSDEIYRVLSFDPSEGNGDMDDIDGDAGITALVSSKTRRLVSWTVEELAKILKEIAARRNSSGCQEEKAPPKGSTGQVIVDDGDPVIARAPGCTVLDEVKEVIKLRHFDKEQEEGTATVPRAHQREDPKSVDLGEDVTTQLREYIETIALLYRDNPFHNFEHASHVAMSVTKLLSRIVAPEDIDIGDATDDANLEALLHDHTYGICSDPLIQFSCVFSALIHDVDHCGVPNSQIIKEGAPIAAVYKNKSVAEQNSVDIAWELLMEPGFADLRRAIYRDQDELDRFRQLVVNSVMATDIMDKDLKDLRNARWNRAFSEQANCIDNVDRKATIVIEHLIQASDVAHTMQHWHIYRKWNERLFREMYKAFKDGRAEKNPAEGWYKGEIGFFDFYIIPLAKKLKNCGVFGVSSDEYLNYAQNNREEWQKRGAEIVGEMMENINNEGGAADETNSPDAVGSGSDSVPEGLSLQDQVGTGAQG